MHQKTYKLIGIQPSIDTMMSRHLPVKFCNSAQQLIPGRYAKYVINQFKFSISEQMISHRLPGFCRRNSLTR